MQGPVNYLTWFLMKYTNAEGLHVLIIGAGAHKIRSHVFTDAHANGFKVVLCMVFLALLCHATE